MKFWCEEDEQIVDAETFEQNDEGEASPHNGIGEHSHCGICQGHLLVRNCRDLAYIQTRLKQNKVKLDKYGAKQHIPSQKLEFYPVELLLEAQVEEKALLYAQSETFRLQNEGIL